MHDDAYIGGRSQNNINASCMTISGGRTKQLDIFCSVTGFTSDFLSFTVVELIRFFHGATQLSIMLDYNSSTNAADVRLVGFGRCKQVVSKHTLLSCELLPALPGKLEWTWQSQTLWSTERRQGFSVGTHALLAPYSQWGLNQWS